LRTSALRGNRAFLKFWAADGVSFAGTMVTTVVLPVLVYQRTGSAFETSFLVAIETVPYLAFGLIAGAVADRVDRRRLMYACELISAILVGSVPLANAFGALTIAQVYLVAAGIATTFVWRDAANFGAIPALVGRDVLASAYSRMASTGAIMQIAGPAAGGVLAATIGPAPAMTVDAASYIISALLLVRLARREVHGQVKFTPRRFGG
jgi:MFS family permease